MTTQDKWKKKNTTIINMRLNNYTDRDVLTYLKSMPSRQGYIKDLIRADMKANGVDIPHPSKKEEAKYEEYLCDLEFGEIDDKEDFVL